MLRKIAGDSVGMRAIDVTVPVLLISSAYFLESFDGTRNSPNPPRVPTFMDVEAEIALLVVVESPTVFPPMIELMTVPSPMPVPQTFIPRPSPTVELTVKVELPEDAAEETRNVPTDNVPVIPAIGVPSHVN
jgi:hypothetical protein